jgi:hypothetical protein
MASKERLMTEEQDSSLVEGWERGEPIELDRKGSPTSVLSIRVPADLLRALEDRAKTQGKPTSHVARELIEAGLLNEGPTTPSEVARMFSRWVEEATGKKSS